MDKYCPGCDQDLDISRFGKNRSTKDGLQSYCKECRKRLTQTKYAQATREYQRGYRRQNREWLSEYSKGRYQENPEYYKQKSKEWKAANPERKKELDRLWNLNNRERANENSRRWAAANREKRKEILRKYNESHREELRIRSVRYRAQKQENGCVPYTKEQLLGKLLVWRYRCYLCDKPLDDTLHWDHVKPISAGGMDMLANLRPTHGRCNQSKAAQWPLKGR